MKTRTLTYAQAINEAMSEEMERDERVFIMGDRSSHRCAATNSANSLVCDTGQNAIAESSYSDAGGRPPRHNSRIHITGTRRFVAAVAVNAAYTLAACRLCPVDIAGSGAGLCSANHPGGTGGGGACFNCYRIAACTR